MKPIIPLIVGTLAATAAVAALAQAASGTPIPIAGTFELSGAAALRCGAPLRCPRPSLWRWCWLSGAHELPFVSVHAGGVRPIGSSPSCPTPRADAARGCGFHGFCRRPDMKGPAGRDLIGA